jgi:hypothetical protein
MSDTKEILNITEVPILQSLMGLGIGQGVPPYLAAVRPGRVLVEHNNTQGGPGDEEDYCLYDICHRSRDHYRYGLWGVFFINITQRSTTP